ncbi:MAG: phosphoribosylanthranilate isomerase [Tannerella sp.]|nr:phosphoribosylanthranilate isomerase [Tannerella sp.]
MTVKVCGMREAENIRAVARLDVDWMGFIFYPASPRCVPEGDDARATVIRQCAKTKVGVFVNAGAEEMLEKAARYGLDYLQLHGHESPALCRTLQQAGCRVVKAFPVATAADLEPAAAYEPYAACFLFDTKCDTYGGSGKRFDWRTLDAYTGRTPFLLSGGLRPESAEELFRFRHPQWAGVDLNSGFETAPALKDVARLEQFIHQLRNKTNQETTI